jgi:hypothetical protein
MRAPQQTPNEYATMDVSAAVDQMMAMARPRTAPRYTVISRAGTELRREYMYSKLSIVDQWRRDASDALRRIAEPEPSRDTLAVSKKKVLKLASDLARVRATICTINKELVRDHLEGEALVSEAERVRLRCQEFAARIESFRLGRSGGKRQSRINASNARVAAWRAFRLLASYGNRPTLTRGGQYFELTQLMIKLATGREASEDAVERACRWYFHQPSPISGRAPGRHRVEPERLPKRANCTTAKTK